MSTGGCSVGFPVDGKKEDREQEVDDSRKQEGEPEANVFLRICGGKHEECTDVDEAVEDEHRALAGQFGIHDDLFA